MHILVVSHSACMYTGLAQIVRLLCKEWLTNVEHSVEITQVALMNVSAIAEVPWRLIPTRHAVLPDGSIRLDPSDMLGQVTIPAVMRSVQPDLVFLFNDPQVVSVQMSLVGGDVPIVAYVPFDGTPIPLEYKCLLQATRLVTMSNFSKKAFVEMSGCADSEIDVVYAPCDTDLFVPVSSGTKSNLRASGFPAGMPLDGFIIGWVGRNQWRKQMWAAYEVISLLSSGHYIVCRTCGASRGKDLAKHFCRVCGSQDHTIAEPLTDVALWIHMPTGRETGDWDVADLERVYKLDSGKHLWYSEGCDRRYHIPCEGMPLLYQMWDVLLFLSGGEGFGLPVLESMACGCPVVYSDYSSHAELLRAGGSTQGVDVILQPEAGTGILRGVPNVYSAVDLCVKLYKSKANINAETLESRRFAVQQSSQPVAIRWMNLFKQLAGE